MIYKLNLKSLLSLVFTVLLWGLANAQQDSQYTQYMYNTMSVNSGYAGQRDVMSTLALYRAQWVGIEGAPRTLSFGIHSPLRNQRLGLGLNVVSDQLGPASESYIDLNFSYRIPIDPSGNTELSFGIKGGMHVLDTDWSKGSFQQSDVLFNENVNLISPTLGAGFYLHSDNWYFGGSVPNILESEHYDDFKESVATERLHFYFIGGYVFNLDALKLKPAFLLKAVSGAPLIADISLNALLNEKITVGLSYRWDDSISGLIGFQITDNLFMGYAYDLTTTGLRNYNSGSHEIMLRFEPSQIGKILSPRFF